MNNWLLLLLLLFFFLYVVFCPRFPFSKLSTYSIMVMPIENYVLLLLFFTRNAVYWNLINGSESLIHGIITWRRPKRSDWAASWWSLNTPPFFFFASQKQYSYIYNIRLLGGRADSISVKTSSNPLCPLHGKKKNKTKKHHKNTIKTSLKQNKKGTVGWSDFRPLRMGLIPGTYKPVIMIFQNLSFICQSKKKKKKKNSTPRLLWLNLYYDLVVCYAVFFFKEYYFCTPHEHQYKM